MSVIIETTHLSSSSYYRNYLKNLNCLQIFASAVRLNGFFMSYILNDI